MSANSFGHLFRIHSFGESHGLALGVVIDGCPAGLEFNLARLQSWLERRRPGQLAPDGNIVTTTRAEKDSVRILSGIYENKTLGTPIAMMVENLDAQSSVYLQSNRSTRVGHADDMWISKFQHVDPRGGGRSSGRETVSRVMAGAVAEMLARTIAPSVRVIGFASAIGEFTINEFERNNFDLSKDFFADEFIARFPSVERQKLVSDYLISAREKGESFGGVVEICITGLPQALGQPVFHKLKSDFAQAFMSVGASTAVELGEGFASSQTAGSEFHKSSQSNVYGGIRGGLSTGEPINFRIYFKPTSSIGDVAKKGRHDPCIVPRAVPVMEAMAWLVIADHLLWRRLDTI